MGRVRVDIIQPISIGFEGNHEAMVVGVIFRRDVRTRLDREDIRLPSCRTDTLLGKVEECNGNLPLRSLRRSGLVAEEDYVDESSGSPRKIHPFEMPLLVCVAVEGPQ